MGYKLILEINSRCKPGQLGHHCEASGKYTLTSCKNIYDKLYTGKTKIFRGIHPSDPIQAQQRLIKNILNFRIQELVNHMDKLNLPCSEVPVFAHQ